MKKLVLLFMVLTLCPITTGCKIKKIDKVTDGEKFANEYGINNNNTFVYAKIDEVIDIFTKGSGIVYFATNECDWCNDNTTILYKALKGTKITKIYYYNPTIIKNKDDKKYQQLLQLVDEKEISLPSIYFIKGGKIIAKNKDLAKIKAKGEEDLSNKVKNKLKQKYEKLIENYDV